MLVFGHRDNEWPWELASVYIAPCSAVITSYLEFDLPWLAAAEWNWVNLRSFYLTDNISCESVAVARHEHLKWKIGCLYSNHLLGSYFMTEDSQVISDVLTDNTQTKTLKQSDVRVSLGKKSCLWSRHTRIETEPLLNVYTSRSAPVDKHGIVILICVDRLSAFGRKYSRRHIVLNPQREEGESFSNCRFSKDFQSRHCGLPTFFIKNRGFSVARGSC